MSDRGFTAFESEQLFRILTDAQIARLHQATLEVLEQTGWRVRGRGRAAEILGLKPSTLESRMKKLGIERP